MESQKSGLLIRRKLGEEVVVGDAVIRVIEVGRKSVRLAIIAPPTTKILRSELIIKKD
jgi:carbon storage regulator CsrA